MLQTRCFRKIWMGGALLALLWAFLSPSVAASGLTPNHLLVSWPSDRGEPYEWVLREAGPASIHMHYQSGGAQQREDFVLQLPKKPNERFAQLIPVSLPEDASALRITTKNLPFRVYYSPDDTVDYQKELRERGVELDFDLSPRSSLHLSMDLEGALAPNEAPEYSMKLVVWTDDVLVAKERFEEGSRTVNLYQSLMREGIPTDIFVDDILQASRSMEKSLNHSGFVLETRLESGDFELEDKHYASVRPLKTVALSFESEALAEGSPKSYRLVADAATRIPKIPVPERQGFVFTGWRFADGTAPASYAAMRLQEDRVLYAHWQKEEAPEKGDAIHGVPSPTIWIRPGERFEEKTDPFRTRTRILQTKQPGVPSLPATAAKGQAALTFLEKIGERFFGELARWMVYLSR